MKFDERESGIPQFESEKSVQQPLILYQMDETEYNDGENVEGNGLLKSLLHLKSTTNC